jgi:plastocyanin
LVLSAVAFAASDTIIATDNSFNLVNYSADQGSSVTFQNSGANPHNVTATGTGPDGKALFRSNTISGGTTKVGGTEYLTTGSYPFICTIHPTTMQGNLNVTALGTPQARPVVTLKLNTKKLAKVVKKGRLQVEINSTAKVDDVALEAKLGKTTIGSAPDLSLIAGRQFEVLKVGKKAKAKLAKKTKATIALNGSVPFGPPATARGKLK